MAEELKQDNESADKASSSDEKLLKQIRDDFRYHKSYWKENYDEAEKDMVCAVGEPPQEFRDDRSGRPCIWPDEVSQYVKQANNNQRQNKRSVKISPRSEGATAKDAEHRQAYWRGIEYASKASSIYTTGYESAAECGFGYWRLNLRITGPNGEQEPRLVRIPNQFTVFPDPDAREADRSDQMRCFVLDTMRETTFARKYKGAKKRSFTAGDREMAPDWFSGDNITIAEYWVREEIDKADGEKRYKVTQHITNGVEILETNDWIGSWIPIIGVYGEEKYIRNGGDSKLRVLSLIRRARGPQQMLAYVASQEAEEFGMAPRAPYLVVKGTVDPEKWKYAHKLPAAYLEYIIPTDWNTQWGPPPPPQRQPFIPNSQAYEIAYERWRRSIQAAMGIAPLPSPAQRQNEKSGIALEKIKDAEAVGSFHITDNFVRALGNTGRQGNELITKLAELDSLPQSLLGRDQKDEDVTIKVAPRGNSGGAEGLEGNGGDEDAASEHLPESEYFFAHRGQFEVTISDGPNYDSEREEASEFADTLLQNLPALGLPPALMQQMLAIAVKLKNIGTYGDEIADLLSPPDPNNLPPQAKAMLAQAHGQVQALMGELQQLKLEKLGKTVEAQGKLAIVQQESQTRMAEADKDRETKVLVAEITTKAQDLNQRMDLFVDMMKQWHSQAHEFTMAMQQQQHEKEMASQQAATAQQQQATQIQADQQSQQAEPDQGQA